jgi:hypothetical protein
VGGNQWLVTVEATRSAGSGCPGLPGRPVNHSETLSILARRPVEAG